PGCRLYANSWVVVQDANGKCRKLTDTSQRPAPFHLKHIKKLFVQIGVWGQHQICGIVLYPRHDNPLCLIFSAICHHAQRSILVRHERAQDWPDETSLAELASTLLSNRRTASASKPTPTTNRNGRPFACPIGMGRASPWRSVSASS